MRLLILSDLHANLTAFEAALEAASGKWDAAVCLGDVVGYGPDPAAVSEKLQSITKDVIRGNHDKAVAGIMTSDDFNPVARLAVDWTQAQLSPSPGRAARFQHGAQLLWSYPPSRRFFLSRKRHCSSATSPAADGDIFCFASRARPQVFAESRLNWATTRRRPARRFCDCRFRPQYRGILACAV